MLQAVKTMSTLTLDGLFSELIVTLTFRGFFEATIVGILVCFFQEKKVLKLISN